MDRQTDRSHIGIAMTLQKNRKGHKPKDLFGELFQLLAKPLSVDDERAEDEDNNWFFFLEILVKSIRKFDMENSDIVHFHILC